MIVESLAPDCAVMTDDPAESILLTMIKLAISELDTLEARGIVRDGKIIADKWPTDRRGLPVKIAISYTSFADVTELLEFFEKGYCSALLEMTDRYAPVERVIESWRRVMGGKPGPKAGNKKPLVRGATHQRSKETSWQGEKPRRCQYHCTAG
jgi:hypothetical protein